MTLRNSFFDAKEEKELRRTMEEFAKTEILGPITPQWCMIANPFNDKVLESAPVIKILFARRPFVNEPVEIAEALCVPTKKGWFLCSGEESAKDLMRKGELISRRLNSEDLFELKKFLAKHQFKDDFILHPPLDKITQNELFKISPFDKYQEYKTTNKTHSFLGIIKWEGDPMIRRAFFCACAAKLSNLSSPEQKKECSGFLDSYLTNDKYSEIVKGLTLVLTKLENSKNFAEVQKSPMSYLAVEIDKSGNQCVKKEWKDAMNHDDFSTFVTQEKSREHANEFKLV